MREEMNARSDDDIAELLELHAAGRFQALLDAATKTAAEQPERALVHSLVGAACAELGRFDEAVSAMRRAVEIDPEDALAHHNLGLVFLRAGRPDEAIASCRRAVELQPDRDDLRHSLGAALFAAGRRREAIASARAALRLAPADTSHARALAEYLIADGADAEAIELLEEAATKEPDDQDLRVVLGEAYARRGRLEEALRCFQVAADLRPQDADLFVRVGQFWGRHNAPEKEIEALERAVGIAPDFGPAHLALAQALLARGRRNDAITAFERCLVLEPGSVEACHLLAAASGQTPASPPDGYVTKLFDDYAASFDRSLEAELEYRTPRHLAELLSGRLPASGKFESVLDLGCGTGLFGIEFRPRARRLSGVDLSPKMIEAARRKQVYDHLNVGDIVEAIRAEAGAYDAYVAADVLIYVGALEEVFDAIRSSARAGALFAFSTEHLESGTYALADTGRYAHSRRYIEDLCAGRALKFLTFENREMRKELDRMVEGGLYLVSA